MAKIRDVLQAEGGPIAQGAAEAFAYRMKFRGASTISSPTVKAYDDGGDDVSATVLSGSATVSGDKVTFPTLQSLDPSASPYRVVCTATVDSNTQSGVLIVHAYDESTLGG